MLHSLRRMAAPLVLAAFGTGLACAAPAARAAELDLPELQNASTVTVEVLDAMLKSGVALDGTVSATVRIADGTTKAEAFYGSLMSDPRGAEIVKRVTESLRFAPSADWLKRHPGGLWTVFWMFETTGCTPAKYDFPRDATAIRVCLGVHEGKFELRKTFIAFELPQDAYIVDELAPGQPRESCFYPYNDRTAGIEGTTVLLVYVNAEGRADPKMILQSAGSESLDDATKACVRKQLYVTKAGTPPSKPGYARFRWDWRLD